ncbi:MAG: serine protease, partial [Dehalococcoidia bacterium]|nr:serine protease [Dehalococcoidia bacterium]
MDIDPAWRAAAPRVVVTRNQFGVIGAQPMWGSAVVVGKRLVVTAFHVAGAGVEYRLDFPNGQSYPARLIAAHPEADVALLQTSVDLPVAPRPLETRPPSTGAAGYVVG